MLVLGDMPPEDEPRPPAQEINRITKAIDTELLQLPKRARRSPSPSVSHSWTTL